MGHISCGTHAAVTQATGDAHTRTQNCTAQFSARVNPLLVENDASCFNCKAFVAKPMCMYGGVHRIALCERPI